MRHIVIILMSLVILSLLMKLNSLERKMLELMQSLNFFTSLGLFNNDEAIGIVIFLNCNFLFPPVVSN